MNKYIKKIIAQYHINKRCGYGHDVIVHATLREAIEHSTSSYYYYYYYYYY